MKFINKKIGVKKNFAPILRIRNILIKSKKLLGNINKIELKFQEMIL
jgi:hypothetical protein